MTGNTKEELDAVVPIWGLFALNDDDDIMQFSQHRTKRAGIETLLARMRAVVTDDPELEGTIVGPYGESMGLDPEAIAELDAIQGDPDDETAWERLIAYTSEGYRLKAYLGWIAPLPTARDHAPEGERA